MIKDLKEDHGNSKEYLIQRKHSFNWCQVAFVAHNVQDGDSLCGFCLNDKVAEIHKKSKAPSKGRCAAPMPVCILGFLLATNSSQNFSRKNLAILAVKTWENMIRMFIKLAKICQIAIFECLLTFLLARDLEQKGPGKQSDPNATWSKAAWKYFLLKGEWSYWDTLMQNTLVWSGRKVGRKWVLGAFLQERVFNAALYWTPENTLLQTFVEHWCHLDLCAEKEWLIWRAEQNK